MSMLNVKSVDDVYVDDEYFFAFGLSMLIFSVLLMEYCCDLSDLVNK